MRMKINQFLVFYDDRTGVAGMVDLKGNLSSNTILEVKILMLRTSMKMNGKSGEGVLVTGGLLILITVNEPKMSRLSTVQ